MGSLASKAYVQALSTENLKSALRKTGIYPLDAKVIDPQVLMPSTINCNKEKTAKEECPTISTEEHPDVDIDKRNENHPMVDSDDNNVTLENDKEVCAMNSLSEVVAGKAITEDVVVRDITEHCEHQRASGKKGKSVKQQNVVNCNQPGPSGLQKIVISDDELSSDASDKDEEKCCVCWKSNPDALKKPALNSI
ncbi:hypothetical protein KUTeg_018712 [Tegillarca granosa]|uniref:Uncharacterized protein n=1 Tax=Tegillarca granosa TaxID=220873 RepID=A0ABQ9EEQ8_TEGGR|nr:hypothetical protein KUTeg_018712 [Tegillarca granosa]